MVTLVVKYSVWGDSNTLFSLRLRPESEYIVFVYIFAVTFNEVIRQFVDILIYATSVLFETSPTALADGPPGFDHDEIVIRTVRYPLHNIVIPEYYGSKKCTRYSYRICTGKM